MEHGEYYRDCRRRTLFRLLLTYFAPLVLLTIYFFIQYSAMVSASRRLHLKAIAENQANTLDLFLSERLVNVANLIDDPKFQLPPGSGIMQSFLEKLQMSSAAFVDVGYFDSAGIQAAYAGPFPALEKRNYSSEPWYLALKKEPHNFIITDIYLGFRAKPHFTIAVSRIIAGQYVVLRATLDPGKIYEYIASLEGAQEVYTSIVNRAGYYQLVTSHIGTPLETSSFVPPLTPRLGAQQVKIKDRSFSYAYSWLRNADWALIVQWSAQREEGVFSRVPRGFLGISAAVILLTLVIILRRARKVVELQMESDRTRRQLEHAAKLASVGELSAGIAHEINNPLAVISEEAGLVKDLMNPELGPPARPEELIIHLDNIHESVFRCRDITGKLLGFVRRSETELKLHDLHRLIDDVVDGLLGREIAVSNIEIIRQYSPDVPPLVTDGNQLQQVLLNILNNAADAITGRTRKITIRTSRAQDYVRIALTDSGKGMTSEQLDRIFDPFYTTKDVGKGTGLGLSVSYGIIKNLGGKIEVESSVGAGSTFTIVLPRHSAR